MCPSTAKINYAIFAILESYFVNVAVNLYSWEVLRSLGNPALELSTK